MKKKYILKKIQEQVARGIKSPNLGGDPVGLKITKQALKKSKEENDSYYKELDKKFRDYMKLDVDNNPSPKVNMTDSDHEMYYGSGMEGLKYDDEGTEKYKKFVERNKELNKPSKDYYLTKDEVEDSYDMIMKDGENYKKHKYKKPDEYQKTPKVRVTNESINKKTMKQLNYKKPFLSYERAMNLIPENFKFDGNKFKMTDGVETYTIKWEGGKNEGNPSVLTYQNSTLIKEDVKKMKHLYGYKSEETLMKTNDALTENQIFRELLGKSRILNEQNPPTGTNPVAGTEPNKATTTGNKTVTNKNTKSDPNAIIPQEFDGLVGKNKKPVTFTVEYKRVGDKNTVVGAFLVLDGKAYRFGKNQDNGANIPKEYAMSDSRYNPYLPDANNKVTITSIINQATSQFGSNDPNKILSTALAVVNNKFYEDYNYSLPSKTNIGDVEIEILCGINANANTGEKKLDKNPITGLIISGDSNKMVSGSGDYTKNITNYCTSTTNEKVKNSRLCLKPRDYAQTLADTAVQACKNIKIT